MNQNLLAYFPLELVVLPGERLTLHIFEPRYKQLINECRISEMNFGIPFIDNNRLAEFGCEVKLNKVLCTDEDGEMDIEVEGTRVFKLKNHQNPIPNKLYSGGNVCFFKSLGHEVDHELYDYFRWFITIITSNRKRLPDDKAYTIYEIATYLNLIPDDKYRFISCRSIKSMRKFLMNYMLMQIEIKKRTKELKHNYFFN